MNDKLVIVIGVCCIMGTLGSLELWQALGSTHPVEKPLLSLLCGSNLFMASLLFIAAYVNKVPKCVWIVTLSVQILSGLFALVWVIYDAPPPFSIIMVLLLLERILFGIRTLNCLFRVCRYYQPLIS
jgi:hypothetical protein